MEDFLYRFHSRYW